MAINRFLSSLINSSRQTKSVIFASVDVILILAALWLSYFLRMDTFHVHDTRFIYLGLIAPIIAVPCP